MTIHHDKFAYGKLKSCDEQLSQDALSTIIRQMNASSDEEEESRPETAEAPADSSAEETAPEPLEDK
ncbi:MAG: hypothetical protein LUE27_04735 [Clostridia bacterium]|nr:hypothetical protein [Clostridia bacterium]